MMQIVYFSQKEQFLAHMESTHLEKVYVTPSPGKADGLRARLPAGSATDVITIAKFTSNLVEHLWPHTEKPEVKRKSELLLIFGILKNSYLPDLGYEQFTQAYNLFSDLRSFTLDQEALVSVMEEQPEVIRKAVTLFWQLLDLTGYLDEHGAYRDITERLRSEEEKEELKKTYVFWGFQHLNGQQVDLLRALAIRYDVIVPFPLTLKENVKKSDWISWLRDHNTRDIILPEIEQTPQASWVVINSREVSYHLKTHLRPHDQIVLGVSKLSPSHLDIVPSLGVSFKIPHQLLNFELQEVSAELKKYRGDHKDLEKMITERIKSASSLKHLRAWQLYQESLTFISQVTDEILLVDPFLLKLLSEVASLNQPRTSFVPASPRQMTIVLKDMSALEDVDRQRRTLLCIDERFEDVQGLGQNYTETIQRALSALGPLKRNELELLFKKWEVRDLFSQGEVIVLMSEGALKHSLIWKRLFQGVTLERIEKKDLRPERKIIDYFQALEKKGFEGRFSASKLQTFMDCPRKFYFSYVDKVFPHVILEKDFDPMTSGTITHEIIERFIKETLSDEDLPNLCREIMGTHIQKKNLSLPQEVYLQRELTFIHRSYNGIQFLRSMEDALGEKIEWRIEEPFSFLDPVQLSGRIDCMGISSRHIFLLDFKSTIYSASTNTEVLEIESIQLWTYVHAASGLVTNFLDKEIAFGYVVLDDPVKSNILTSDDDLVQKFKSFSRPQKLKDEFADKLTEARDKITNLANSISAESFFPARPRKTGICNYCELNKVCIKSEILDVPVT